MVVKKEDLYHNLISFSSLLLILLPAALVTGPFLSDLFVVIISIIFLLINKVKKQPDIFKNTFFKLFIFFWIYIVIRALFSDHLALSLKPSLTYIRFGIFVIAILFILENQKNIIKFFYLFLFITLILLVFDGYFQFFFGKNIFGYSHDRPDRLGGLFFEELILGSFISKMLPIFMTLIFLNKKILNIKFVYFFLFLSYLLIFLSGERSAFILITFYFILILPFIFNPKKIILIILAIIITLSLVVISNKNLKSRYIDQMLMHTVYQSKETKIFMPEHLGFFYSSIDTFKKNIIFGTGVKTFREECKNINKDIEIKLKKKMSRIKFCSTHPHNYYLQLLAETGLIGFLFLLLIFIKLFINYIKQFIMLFKNKSYIDKSYVCILSGIIVSIWPLTTSGNFFNNWISVNLFLSIGIFLYISSHVSKK